MGYHPGFNAEVSIVLYAISKTNSPFSQQYKLGCGYSILAILPQRIIDTLVPCYRKRSRLFFFCEGEVIYGEILEWNLEVMLE